MTEKMDKMQQIIDQIQEDIYEFGDPYEDEEDGCAGQLGGGHAKEKQFIFKILYCDLFCFFLSADSGDDGIFI